MSVLTATDFRGLYGIIPTPARPDTGWESADEPDLEEIARVVDALIADGASGIIALGTTGECATLSSVGYAAVVQQVCAVVAKRVPVFVGTTAMGWYETMSRLEIARAAGADGTLLGLPMWQPMTEEMAIRFYAHVSSSFPDLSLMVYANERAFRFPFSSTPSFWNALQSAAPTVTSAKFSRSATYGQLRDATDGKLHFLPNDSRVLEFAQIAPDAVTACWATAASMGPEPCLRLINAINAGDHTTAAATSADIARTNESLAPIMEDPTIFASYNIQVEKVRINAAGYCNAGPIRPPYDVFPEKFAAAATESGQLWRQLREQYLAQS